MYTSDDPKALNIECLVFTETSTVMFKFDIVLQVMHFYFIFFKTFVDIIAYNLSFSNYLNQYQPISKNTYLLVAIAIVLNTDIIFEVIKSFQKAK